MRTIFLDVGNHSVKAWGLKTTDLIEGEGLVCLGDVALDAAIRSLDGENNDVQLIVSNVRGGTFQTQLQDQTRGWVIEPHFLSITDFPDFITHYKKPETMGIDRVAAVQGASAQFKGSVIIIDAGTVVTVDCLDESGIHTGGYFFPGLHLIRQTISANAEQIKPVLCDSGLISKGQSTDECICSGTLLGWVAAISGLVTTLCTDEDHLVVVCGGGGELLLEYMQTDQQVRFRPELVFDGMRLAVVNK